MSLSFDDARLSQIERGMPIFATHGVKATFYVSPAGVEKRADAWRAASEQGHEIGNHTCTHPCSGNFPWSRANALEDYTLERMTGELDRADAFIRETLGVTPRTFAYPCAQTFVGRGQDMESYVPLVAGRYRVGRHAFNEIHNAPDFCDLALVTGFDSDGASFDELKAKVEAAIEAGAWIVFVSHEISAGGRQTMIAGVLDQLCQYARDHEERLWTATIAAVGTYIHETRKS
jgi:peptidoglycan/xylan/chitin deacetylase (PgdA/CDA1 family)